MTENKELDQLIVEGIQERKGKGITIVDLSEVEGAGVDRFIICEGTSSMHVSSVADSIREYVQEVGGIKPYNYDGYRNSQWIVIDYGSVLVHVFLPETRQLYNLEELWNDGKITEIADLD